VGERIAITENQVEKRSDSDTRTTLDKLNDDAMIDDDTAVGMRSKICSQFFADEIRQGDRTNGTC